MAREEAGPLRALGLTDTRQRELSARCSRCPPFREPQDPSADLERTEPAIRAPPVPPRDLRLTDLGQRARSRRWLTDGEWNLGGGGVRVMLVKMELRVEAPTGDEADIDAFCRRTHPRLVRTLAAATGDAALADELAQEALARAWERWSHVRTLDLPEAWCYRVAINLARSQFRRRAAARRAHERMPAPLTTVDGHESSDDELMSALRHLPEQQRAVVALRFLADLSVETTAEVLGIPTGTVKSTTNRALAALRTQLEPRAADDQEDRT